MVLVVSVVADGIALWIAGCGQIPIALHRMEVFTMMLDRHACSRYVLRNSQRKPRVNVGMLLWGLWLIVFSLAVLMRIVFAP